MKSVFNITVLAVLLVVPGECFALWDVISITRDEAKELGLEVRTTATEPNHVSVQLEFKTEGKFEGFRPESKLKDRSGVYLRIGEGKNLSFSAGLREDRSKPDRVLVGFTSDRTQLDRLSLQVMVPYSDGALGGAVYELRIKDFVDLKENR